MSATVPNRSTFRHPSCWSLPDRPARAKAPSAIGWFTNDRNSAGSSPPPRVPRARVRSTACTIIFFDPTNSAAKIAHGEFLEWAQVHGEHEDRLYGTLKSSVLDPLAAGQNLVMSIDVQGVESLRRVAARGRTAAPGFDDNLHPSWTARGLISRMRERAKDHEDEIERRMATAEAELREAAKFDFVIESHTRDDDFAALLQIVEKAQARSAV